MADDLLRRAPLERPDLHRNVEEFEESRDFDLNDAIAEGVDELWRGNDLDAAVRRGMIGGAAATAWPRPLPDDAYGP